MIGKFGGTINTGTGQVALRISEWIGATVAFNGTFGSANGVFEVSMDSTNGTDGTWFQVQAFRSNASVAQESVFGPLTNTPAYFWHINLGSWDWLRVRMTSLSSGLVNVVVAPYAQPHTPASQVVSQHTGPLGRLRNTQALTLTSDVALFTAAGANRSNNVVDIQAINTGASAVDLIIKDGATVIWQFTLPVNVPVCFCFECPLRGTANTAINVTLSAAGTVRLNATGFVSV